MTIRIFIVLLCLLFSRSGMSIMAQTMLYRNAGLCHEAIQKLQKEFAMNQKSDNKNRAFEKEAWEIGRASCRERE